MIKKSNEKRAPRIDLVDYFPLTIVIDDDTDLSEHNVFEYANKNCLELVLDRQSKKLLKLILVLCEKYAEYNEPTPMPKHGIGSEVLYFDLPKTTNCSIFNLTLFNDGFTLALENEPVEQWLVNDSLAFGINTQNGISIILANNLSSIELNHIKEEIMLSS